VRRGLIAAGLVLASLAAAQPAHAALKFHGCNDLAFKCARLSVPLDRTGRVPGRVSLLVKRSPSRSKKPRGVVVAFAGGPGQSATAAYAGDALGPLGDLLKNRDLVVFDQRGTGGSGLLRCPALERANILRAGPAAASCAASLGPRRAFYTSRDTAEDLEAIRSQLGVPALSLYGVSYGTRTALTYAQRYPSHVDRMVLDSTVKPDGADALNLDTFRAVPRVLRALCGRHGCDGITRDPVADVARLTARIAARGSLRGRLVDARGKGHPARASRYDVFSALVAGDFEPELRRQYPAAVVSALHGDAAPMLRLKRRAIALESAAPDPRELSSAVYAATTCEESRLPWPRQEPFARRGPDAVSAVNALAPAPLAPFDRTTALGSDVLDLCSRWPEAPTDPDAGSGPLPRVPTLFVDGADDLRTPEEGARAVATEIPGSKVVPIQGVGHSPISLGVSRCATRLIPAFFAGRKLPSACRDYHPLGPSAVPPGSLGAVPPIRGVGGRPGRAGSAMRLTLRDVVDDLVFGQASSSGRTIRDSGLRGGTYVIGARNGLVARRLSFVPGIRVTGRVARFGGKRQHGRLRVSGPRGTRGVVRIEGRHFSGRLGGRRVAGALRLGLASLSSSARASAAAHAPLR
jgi:pimeloyl-ACP methyl ester carboxylesterase